MRFRITQSVLAYAAGDAFGVQFEFEPRTSELIQTLEAKDGWPKGGVSDDTFLSLLTIESLKESDPVKAAELFLNDLRRNANKLRGLGPTTRTALGLEVKDGERGVIGNTNGAMMRTSLAGLAFPPWRFSERQAWISESALKTHQHVNAVSCAVLMSAAFSASTSDDGTTILESIHKELDSDYAFPDEVTSAIEKFHHWAPSQQGTSLDPLETLLAVLHTVSRARDCMDAYSRACALGGDTDTVAALSGALYCAWNPGKSGFFEIDWLPQVQWSEIAHVKSAIELLINLRGAN